MCGVFETIQIKCCLTSNMAVAWCSGSGFKVRVNGELTSCFIDTLLLIPTAIVLFILIPALVLILQGKSKVFGQSCVRFKHHSLRWLLTILLLLCYLVKIGEGFMYQEKISSTPLHLYLPNMLSFVCLILVSVYYDIVEVSQVFPIKKLAIIFMFWLSSVIVWTIKFVQLYQVEGPYDIRLYSNLCILVFYTLLLIIERRVIFSLLPGQSPCSSWSRANKSEMEGEAFLEFEESFKFVHDFSNFLSRCTFWWMQDTLKLGNRRPLEPEDLGELPPIYKADFNHVKFIKIWQKEKLQATLNQSTPSIWHAFFVTFRSVILTTAASRLAGDALSFIGPLCLKQIVNYVEQTFKSNGGDATKPLTEDDVNMSNSDFFGNGFVLSVVILFGNIASTTCLNYHYYLAIRFSMNIRACLQVRKKFECFKAK